MKVTQFIARLVLTFAYGMFCVWLGANMKTADVVLVMEYEGCKVVKTTDDGTPVYLSICDDRSAVTWRDEKGNTRHTISERN